MGQFLDRQAVDFAPKISRVAQLFGPKNICDFFESQAVTLLECRI
jgi:hypothetical protein